MSPITVTTAHGLSASPMSTNFLFNLNLLLFLFLLHAITALYNPAPLPHHLHLSTSIHLNLQYKITSSPLDLSAHKAIDRPSDLSHS